MKYFKLKGGTKKQREKAEFFLDQINFESQILDCHYETLALDVLPEETPTYKKMVEELKNEF